MFIDGDLSMTFAVKKGSDKDVIKISSRFLC